MSNVGIMIIKLLSEYRNEQSPDLSNSRLNARLESLKVQIREIFFLSSKYAAILDTSQEEAFFNRWAGSYIENYDSHFYLALSRTTNQLLGYLSGCPNSLASLNKLDIPCLSLFEDLFTQYPAHLHINCHPLSRGKGIGTQLINQFCKDLCDQKIPGVHIITSPTAKNIGFYKRTNFSYQTSRKLNETSFHFMGRVINTQYI